MRRIVIAGSTGSIGTQALDVIARSESLEVVGLAAHRNAELVLEQAAEYGVSRVALADEDAAARAAERWTDGEVLAGAEGLIALITEAECDLVLNALVGSAGLGPTVAALGEGIDLALANKESLVVGGELVMALAEATGATLLPVDSEHSALFQLVNAEPAPRHDRPPRAHRLGRSVPGPHRPLRHHAGRRARAPHVGHGRQDHDRLGHADEQGPRGDRGAPSVRRRRTTASAWWCTPSRSCTR